MSDSAATALYRRFRPGRFAELRGQEHVVRALQGAVANGRVSHAYLFSGPRGTGKTTTARILAKALNCASPVDGDACGECASCIAITKGSSLDVIELDAASNNGIESIREITSGAWVGTPGRWKVYIFDEVHQLSKPASAALLKTLEEPPAHVVFVLATTDPHKVLPTIRSRTQHLEFRLITGETLQSLLSDVQQAAGLSADASTLEAAVRLGKGSARDALSALDQLLATGGAEAVTADFSGVVEAIINSDASGVIAAVAALQQAGWETEQLAENLAGELRQAFLLLVAPEVADAVDVDRARLQSWGEQLGLPKTVRSLETIGRALREMKSAPDPTVILEIALVRLVRPELDQTYASIDERLSALERGGSVAPPSATPPPPAPRAPIGASKETPPDTPAASPTPAPPQARNTSSARTIGEIVGKTAPLPTRVDESNLAGRFKTRVVNKMPAKARMALSQVNVVSLDGDTLTLAVANDALRASIDAVAGDLAAAVRQEFERPLSITWIINGKVVSAPEPPRVLVAEPAPASVEPEVVSDDDVAVATNSVPELLINEFFPGAEEIS